MSWRWRKIILPITRLELPGWGRVLRCVGKVGYQHDELWSQAPKVTIRGKSHGFMMELDLTNWSARNTYFLGRYYELHMLKLLDHILKPGDRFLDIGANVGMIALHAAHIVGPAGRVDCFEPNPTCQLAINETCKMNGIKHVNVHPFGLSDQDAILDLKLNHSHSGIGTFADLAQCDVVAKFSVQVKVGDDFFRGDSASPRLIKVDVEGFEHKVVLGLRNTLAQWKCPLVMECNEPHLRRAGTSAIALYDTLSSMGYTPFRVGVKRHGFGHSLDLTLIESLDELLKCRDVFWTRDSIASR